MVMTKNLKPAVQCSNAAGRATSVLHQLRKVFLYRDRHMFMKLYKQYVRPHLEFSTPAWSPWNNGDKEIIEKVQEKAVRMVAGLKGSSYEERCKELGLETLESRRQRQGMSLVNKFLGEQDQKLFTLAGETGRVQTRHAKGSERTVCQNRYEKVLLCCTSSRKLEQSAGHHKAGRKFGGLQEQD